MKKNRFGKQILSLVLVMLMMASLMPFSVLAAEGEPTIQVENVSALPGSTVSVNITLKDNPGIAAARMKVAFDSSVLTLQSLSYGDAYAADGEQPETYSSPVTLSWSSLSDVTSDGAFATLTFLVNTSAETESKTSITLSYAKSDIINLAEQDVDFAIENGTIEIISGLPGDINGDGERNAKDLLRARKYFANWQVDADPIALDANGDGAINAKDLLRLRKFFADWDVVIWYGKISYSRSALALTPVPYKAPSCEEKGNILYYYDQNSGKCYRDANAVEEITLADTEIAPTGHTPVTDPAVAPTRTTTGLTEGSHCEVCGKVLVPQEIVQIPVKSHTITYNYASGQPYLTKKLDELIERNEALGNPTSYNEGDEFLIKDLDEIVAGVEPLDIGFIFKGWYTASGARVDHISTEDKQNYTLYARWEEESFSVQYNVFKTPVAAIETSSYTTSKGLYNLPNPDVYNCIFLGWYDEDGNEVTSIPVGSTGNRVLNAYFTTMRNYAVGKKLEKPIRVVDSDNGVILYAYEIGTIKNVPVSDAIWTVQAVEGLAQKTSVTESTSISKSLAQSISDTVAASTQNSNTWSLSSDWTDKLTVDSEWAEERGLDVDVAKEQAKTQSGTLSTTSSHGGSDTTTDNTGTTTLKYDSKNVVDEDATKFTTEKKGHFDVEVGLPTFFDSASISAGVEIDDGEEKSHSDSTDTHSGTDTTTLDTTNHTKGSTWNDSTTDSQTTTDSTRKSTTVALSHAIKEVHGYSAVRENGGSEGSTSATAATKSTTKNSSNTITYSEQTVTTTTKEYSADGKSDGWYRLVMAADVHVFGVVGYDIACRSFFTYTYSIVDGNTYEFLDYSPDGVFTDMQNTVLPFEVPIDILEYSKALSIETEGLEFDYNNEDHTATVEAYTGDSTEVNVPTYTVDDRGTVYKVIAMTADAFQGKNITKINLSQKITSIPAEAFKDCASLEYVILPNVISIGSKAFSGCTSLKNFKLGTNITELGDQAFVDCPAVEIKAADEKVAVAAANCGAKNIELDVSAVPTDSPMKLSVSGGDTFYLDGGEKTFTNISMESHAVITSLNSIYFSGCTQPIKLYSPTVNLYKTEVRNSNGFCMILAAEQTALILSGTNVMSCVQDKAILCKNVTVSYSNSGKLNATGDIYHAGTISDPNKRIVFSGTSWDYEPISTDEFELYLQGEITISFDVNGGDELNPASKTAFRKTAIGELPVPTRENHDFIGWFTEIEGGKEVTKESSFDKDTTVYAHWEANTFTVTFDANGGEVDVESKEAYVGATIGELPVPTRDYYDFDGWFTEADGGEEVTSETVCTSAEDVTLYAHWTQHEVSDWVPASERPEGAEEISEKWTYTETEYTTGDRNEKTGWSLYDTERTSWGATQGPVYSDPSNGSRNVWSEPYVTSSNYKTVYVYYRYYDPSYPRASAPQPGTYLHNGSITVNCYTYEEQVFDSPISESEKVVENGNTYYKIYYMDGNVRRYWAFYYSGTRQQWVSDNYGTCWYYQEPVYTYYFKRDVAKETTPAQPGTSAQPGGANIFNVQRWVQYRAK